MEAIILMLFYILFFGILVALCAFCYVITALANMRVLKHFNHKNSWGAWIPYYGSICLAQCMMEENGNIDAYSIKIPKKYFVFWPLWAEVVNFIIPTLGSFLGLMAAMAVYKDLLSQKSGKEEWGLAIVSGLVPFAWVFVAFSRFKGQKQESIVESN